MKYSVETHSTGKKAAGQFIFINIVIFSNNVILVIAIIVMIVIAVVMLSHFIPCLNNLAALQKRCIYFV